MSSFNNKCLLICMHPDGYNPGYGYVVPWPTQLAQPEGFTIYNTYDGDKTPVGEFIKSMMRSDATVDQMEEDEEEEFCAPLERRVLALGGTAIGDMNPKTHTTSAVNDIQGIIHYGS